jgi:2,3-bisphosphoglycerate-independent phosphoglycerate mutase
MKKILVILDGASDLPITAFENKTPLEAAKTPNLDWFSKNSKLGYMYTIDEKTVPGSDNSLISIFGNDPKECKRGVYEAIGLGIKLKRGDLALRTNL